MHIILPQSKTYLPGPLRCIYCQEYNGQLDKLSREHVIPRKLGGKLVLHHASCKNCACTINKQIETPILAEFLKQPGTHLKMPTSKPVNTLPIGRWKTPTKADLRFDEVPLEHHPFRLTLPRFAPPGILWDEAPSIRFMLIGFETYFDGRPYPPGTPGEQTGTFFPFKPDIFLRFIAKIAHGAAVSELGLNAFSPLLPDIILGKSPYISHLAGNVIGRRISHRNNFQHTITMVLRRGYIVAIIRLFNVTHSYVAVVGRARVDLARLHTSALMHSAIFA
jgi:HNH endonuclease